MDDGLSRLTRRLSELLASDEGTLVLAQLQKLALLAAEQASQGDGRQPEQPGPPTTIGVWTREGDEWVRDPERREEWRYWAEVERIGPKRGPRVVLLGESVARGYFYDPAVAPAAVLEAMLSGVRGLAGVEVLDLAATDLVPDDLVALAASLPELEPDAVVLFAGNNWHRVAFQLRELDLLAEALRRDGYPGCRRVFLDDILVPRCRSAMTALAERIRPLGVPLVVLVPEFNLRDWRSEPSVLAPVLAAGANEAWMMARRRAEEALAAGELEEAARAAEELVTLDGGTSAVGQELLGAVLLGLGRTAEARSRLEGARDAVCGLFVAHSPRCSEPVHRVLREGAATHGFALVDLPRVFEEYLDGGLPDRRLLLDYCHLTLEGMRVAMAATAAELAPLLGAPAVPASDLRATPVGVAPQDEAVAHFLAALHNAHYGQCPEILRHHCERAADLAPAGRELMLLYLDFQCRRAEQWMCASFEEACRSPLVRRYLAATDARVMDKLADFALVDVVVGVLEERGIEVRENVEALLREEHGRAGRVDLLQDRYHARTFRERKGYSLGLERGYYQALDVWSRFHLVLDGPRAVRLRLACRLPHGPGGEVAVTLNGRRLAELPAEPAWRTFDVAVPPEATRAGLNQVELEWPLPRDGWAGELERAARNLERGIYPDALPVFGEVHALTASAP